MAQIYKLIIKVARQDDLIDSFFDEIGESGITKKLGTMFVKKIYKIRLKTLYSIIRKRVREYIEEEGESYFVAVEEGDKEYIKAEENKLRKFLFGGEKTLKDFEEYKKFRSDRIMQVVVKKFGRWLATTKDMAISKALSGGRVIDFFNRCGIVISLEVQEVRETEEVEGVHDGRDRKENRIGFEEEEKEKEA